MFCIEFFFIFVSKVSKVSPPSVNRFRRNFAARRTFVGNSKRPLYILLGALKEIRGQNPILAIFRTSHQDFAVILYREEILQF